MSKYVSRYHKLYNETIVTNLMKELGLSNVMECPKLDRIVVNMGVGEAKVTLRKERMYDFLDRLVNVVLPRVRDFEGVPADSFDGRGNYSLGLRDQLVFPEIEFDKVDKLLGMSITIVSSAKTDEEGRALLKAFGMPFKK